MWLGRSIATLLLVLGLAPPTAAQQFFPFGTVQIGKAVRGGTAGSVLFVGAGGVLAQDNANLFWDDVNKGLGIGVTSNTKGLAIFKTGSNFSTAYPAIELRSTSSTAVAGPGIYLNGSLITNGAQWLMASTATGEGVPAGHFAILQIGATPDYRFVINKSGVVGIGTTAFPSTGTQGLVFGDGTALATMGLNTAGLYADDVGGTVNMFAIDEAGNVQQLVTPQTITFSGFTFLNIGVLTANGMMGYCSDCQILAVCAGAGTGAIAKRLNGVNVCN